MKKSLWLPLAAGVLLTSGCGTKQEIASTGTSTTSTALVQNGTALTTPSDPKEVVRLFLDSMRQGNGAQLSSLLSSLAREEIKRKELEIAPLGSPLATFQILEAAEQDGGMLVSSTWTEPEQPGQPASELEVVWELRKEPAGWRICGMAVDPKNGDEVQIVDFEKLEPEQPAPTQDPQRVAALPNAPTGFPANSAVPAGNVQPTNLSPSNSFPTNNGFTPNNARPGSSIPPVGNLPPVGNYAPAGNYPPAGNYAPASAGNFQPTNSTTPAAATGFQPTGLPSSNLPSNPSTNGLPQPSAQYGNPNQLPPIVPGNFSLPPANSAQPISGVPNQIRR